MRSYPASRPVLRWALLALALCLSAGSATAKTVQLANAKNGLAAAIKEAGPGGTVILRGLIQEEQTIEIPHSIHLRGLNNDRKRPTLLLRPTDRLNAIVVLGDDVELSNLNIEPSSELYGNLGTAIFAIGSRFRMVSCQVSRWRIGVFLSGTETATVAGNTFSASPLNQDPDHLGAAVYAQFAVGNADIKTNTITGFHVGAYIQDSAGYDVSLNRLEKNTIGVWMDGAVDSRVSSNRVLVSGQAGILLTEGASTVNVRQNSITGSGGDSIMAAAGTSGNTIMGNGIDKPVNNLGSNTVKDNRITSVAYRGGDRDEDDDD